MNDLRTWFKSLVLFGDGGSLVGIASRTTLAYEVSLELQRAMDRDAEAPKEAQSEFDLLRKLGYLPLKDELHPGSDRMMGIVLNLVRGCNMGCSYCNVGPSGSYGGAAAKMSVDTGKKAIDFLIRRAGEQENLAVSFFGGEPFLNWDLIQEVVLYAESVPDRDWHFSLTTNGTLVDASRAAFLAAHHIRVIVTLSGPAEVHDQHRTFVDGRGTHANVLQGLRTLLDQGVHCEVHSVWTTNSPRSVTEIRDYFRETLPPNVDAAIAPEQREFSADAAARKRYLDDQLTVMREEARRYQGGETALPGAVGTSVSTILSGPMAPRAGCPSGTGYFQVAPNGDLFACHIAEAIGEYKVGSVLTDFDEAQRSDVRNRFLRVLDPCSVCWAHAICGGPCHIQKDKSGSVDPAYCAKIFGEIELAAKTTVNMTTPQILDLWRWGSKPEALAKLEQACRMRDRIRGLCRHIRPLFLFPANQINAATRPMWMTLA